MMGATGKIDFDYVHPDYVGKLRTVLTPHRVETSDLAADNLTVNQTAEIGNPTTPEATGSALKVHGNTDMDYLHLTGNPSRPLTDPQLVVDGNAVIKNLNVTGTLTGVTANVDGIDIRPLTVTTDQIDVKRVNVSETLNVTGNSVVKNLQITGTVTGLVFPPANVDGIDIKPKSVVATNSSTFGQTTTVNDLVVTGTTTGISANVTGQDITPKSVATTGFVTVGGTLTVTGSSSLPTVKSQLITMNTLSETISTATYAMKITHNMQNLTLGSNTIINVPATPPAGGATFMIYLVQDATGGRTVSFGANFSQLNAENVNPAANSVTLVQVIYRGAGTVYDVVVTPRP
jgi:cytoskeletal protein CcmA (bactofilin family)